MTQADDSAGQRIRAAMREISREAFLPGAQRADAGRDEPIDIGLGQTNSQPTTVRNMLRLLNVRPGDRVLDVGSGSGWTTALLARLTGPAGMVTGLEIVPELVQTGAANLASTGQPWASIEQASRGTLGAPDRAPFERILVSAAADALPRDLVDQLGLGGVLVVPVAGTMLKVTATPGPPIVEEHGHYRFVPLITT